ncbi:MAG: hypothetical protein D6772_13145 [Bacteroidetes bacterium]|nr:MAG: hypothetical protein D6772_13145 [Bacteroidota bacterium]
MLRSTPTGKYRIEQELSAEELAQLRLALLDITMELLRAPLPSDEGSSGLHYLLLFFRPCLEDEVAQNVGK